MPTNIRDDVDLRPDELRVFFDVLRPVDKHFLRDIVAEVSAITRSATDGYFEVAIDQIITGSVDFRFRFKRRRSPRVIRERWNRPAREDRNSPDLNTMASVASAVIAALSLAWTVGSAKSAAPTIINIYNGQTIILQSQNERKVITDRDFGTAAYAPPVKRIMPREKQRIAEAVRVAEAAPRSEWLTLAGQLCRDGRFKTIFDNRFEMLGEPDNLAENEIVVIEAEVKLTKEGRPALLVHDFVKTDHQ